MNTTCGFHFPNETLQRRQCTQRDWVNNSHVGHDSFEGDSGYFKWLWSCWIWHRRYCKYISFWSGGWRHLIVEVLDLNFAKKKKKKHDISVRKSSLTRFLKHLLLIPSQMLPVFGMPWHFHFQTQLATSSIRTLEELHGVWFEFRCKNDQVSSAFYLLGIAG